MNKSEIASLISIICLIAAFIMGAIETKNWIDKISSYQPDVVYEMCNKNIRWD